jgi:hypothetical protein
MNTTSLGLAQWSWQPTPSKGSKNADTTKLRKFPHNRLAIGLPSLRGFSKVLTLRNREKFNELPNAVTGEVKMDLKTTFPIIRLNQELGGSLQVFPLASGW